ncbi:hypothetical protein [Actinoplanes solisilvae]|uniref:hypothetical protein n=1 Tax=Actinoplanes solisilvae TaxID=2486853 RepID=UPI000FDB48BD|nr:hypothetical protein [Actinoplanes solisilvae]
MATEVMPIPQALAVAPEKRHGRTRWLVITVLAVGWLAGVVWRLWLGHQITHPIAHADEDSYLNAARAIAGGPGGFSSETPLLRRIGYPLLVSPAFLFGLDFVTSYKIVQVVNALISALTLPVAYLLARRMFGLKTWIAIAAAFVSASMPAGVFWSLTGITDSIMAPVLLGWFLAIHWWLTDPHRRIAAIATGALTGALYLIHIRGTILTVVLGALLAWMLFRRRASWGVVGWAALPVAVAVVLNQAVISLVGDKVHLRGDIVGGGTTEILTDGQRLTVLLSSAGTNIWYMCVVTGGLAGIAWAVSALELFRPTRDRAFRGTSAVAVLSTLGVTLAAAVVLAGLLDTRADAIYSRYVQVFVPFWILFGFAVLAGTRLRTRLKYAVLPALILLGGGVVIAYRLDYVAERGNRLGYGAFGGPDFITITGGFSSMRPYVGAAIGLTGLIVFVALVGVRRLMIPLLALVVLANVVTMSVMRDRVIQPLANRYTLPVNLEKIGVGPGDSVAFTPRISNEAYYVLYHDVHWTEFTLLDDDTQPGDFDVVVGRYYPDQKINWDGQRYGYELLLASDKGRFSVWRRR